MAAFWRNKFLDRDGYTQADLWSTGSKIECIRRKSFLGNASCTSATVFTKCCKTFSPQVSVWQVFIGNFGYMLELILHSFPNGMRCVSEGIAL